MISLVLVLQFLVITCSPFLPSCTGQDATTLASRESFLMFSEWIPMPQRILRFTFRTSELNGVLLYSEGCDRPDYLLIRLVNGTIEVKLSLREGNVETRTLGEFLNDNQPHIFTVYHNPNPQILQFRYTLDSSSPVVEGYASDLVPAFGSGGVFIGGAPPEGVLPNISPLVNGTSFIGCVEDVLFANAAIVDPSVPSSSLQALVRVGMGGVVRDGCPDPCSGVNCEAGICVARLPDHAFCDCRGTGMLGESCSEDAASHQLTFEPSSGPTHYCHQILPEPYEANSVSLQLVPPIPSEGTILVAHPDDGRHSFSLRVEDGRVVFEYETTDNVTRRLTLETDLDLSNTVYQVDLSTSSRTAELVLLNASTSQLTTVVERQNTGSGNVLYASSTIFTTVCVGGSLMEYDSYVGTIRSAFYSYNSLLEERNFCQLATEGVGRSDLVVFADNGIPRVLTFERFPLGSHSIAFQARSRVEDPSGILLLVENSPYHFSLNVFNGGLFVVLRRDVQDGTFEPNFICADSTLVPAFNGEWHSYEIMLDANPPNGNPSLMVRVDGMSCDIADSTFSREALPMLINSSLQFGATDEFFQNTGEPAIFSGCVSGIELQLTPDSEVFRPNLEAAPRNSDSFDADTCFHCVSKNIFCGNGQVCTDREKEAVAVCECPEGFTGDMCDELIEREVSLSNLAPNLTCPTLPPTTPTAGTSTSLCPVITTTQSPQVTTAQHTPQPPVSSEPSRTSLPPNSTNSPTSLPPNSTNSPTPTTTSKTLSVGVWAGIGVAIAVVVIILITLLIGLCLLYRRGARIRGFYQTNESSSQDAPMIRYSASLRQLSSEIVSVSKESPDDLSWSQKNGDYANGGPPSKSTNQASINRTSESRDKEFYL